MMFLKTKQLYNDLITIIVDVTHFLLHLIFSHIISYIFSYRLLLSEQSDYSKSRLFEVF